MNALATSLAIAALLLSGCGAAAPQPTQQSSPTKKEHPVSAALLADASSVAPGKKFMLGVHLTMKPGWHVYWKNPGDAGLPVSVDLTLPNGTTAGPISWPVPERYAEEGDIVTFGYHDEVLLMIPITVAPQIAVGSSMPISAKLKWLTCEKVCIQGSAETSISLPVADAAAPANAQLFDSWTSKLPTDATRGGPVQSVHVAGNATGPSKATYVVTLTWRGAVKVVDAYLGPDPSRNAENLRVETKEGGTRISFDTEILAGQKSTSDILELVVAYEDERGARLGVTVPVATAEPVIRGPK